MAANLGATSLADVHHEGLDQLLHDLADVYPHGVAHQPLLGVPVIDALLDVFMQRLPGTSIESNRQLHDYEMQEQSGAEDAEMLLHDSLNDGTTASEEASAQRVTERSNVFFVQGSAPRNKRPSAVVEISSSQSGAGKTQLLYYMTARAILPRTFAGIPVGGLEAAVVWIDADDRFDVYRLREVARGILRHAQKSAEEGIGDNELTHCSDAQLTEMLTASLQHVHIFGPQSSSALLATLGTLDNYLYDLSQHHSASRPLHLLVVDSATAFFWQDKLRDEVARTEEIGHPRTEIDLARQQKQSFYLSDLYAEIVSELKRLQGRFGCAVVYTTTVSTGRPAASSHNRGPTGPLGPYDDHSPHQARSLRPALPAPWGTFPVLRLVVRRDAVRPFPPGMSAHDARREAPMRQSVVRQGKFSAWVNAWGREEWPRRVVDGVNWYNGGCFPFYVRATGVEVPPPDDE